jgi:hypothetical protein
MGYVEKARAHGARLDDYDWRMLQTLDEHGWMVLMVGGDESNPPFAYTVGAMLHRPDLIPWELMVVGMDLEEGKRTLNRVVLRAVERGEPLTGGPVEDLFDGGLAGYIAEIPAERITPDWFGYGMWFARAFSERGLRVAQVVWPDGATGRLPWDFAAATGGTPEWADQPLLCDHPDP